MSAAPRAVPLHSPGARHAADAPAREAAALRALRSGRYVGGPERDAFEAALADAMGWPFAVGVSSGTEALSLALMALGLQPGDEVLVPAVSFFATAGAVLRLGARPVMVDVRADLPLMDEQDAILAMGPQVRAAVPVHLFGLDAGATPSLRGAYPALQVVDDLAQAAGSGPSLGGGRFGALSFYPTKVLGAPGDGGAVLCRDIDDQQRVVRLGHHGRGPTGAHEAVEGWISASSAPPCSGSSSTASPPGSPPASAPPPASWARSGAACASCCRRAGPPATWPCSACATRAPPRCTTASPPAGWAAPAIIPEASAPSPPSRAAPASAPAPRPRPSAARPSPCPAEKT
jgi:hypothetical protein